MECFEKGILTREDTDGLELTFGNAEAMVEMVERIAMRKGFGSLLGEGTKRASEKIGKGSDEFAMHVKGEEIPMHEPRYKQGMGLHYSVHETGADHCTGIHDDRLNKDFTGWDGIDVAESIPTTEMSTRKARMVYHVGLWRQMGNYLGLCLFVPWSYKQIRDATEAITGWPMSYWKLMKAVERGITIARIFNLREGLTAKDDTLPRRFFTSPSEGPLKGVIIDPEKLEQAQRVYYQMLGWDESGVPTFGRLVELDIEWASEYLEHLR
jgi:aldehyde:ferredoxin oxidoreductase